VSLDEIGHCQIAPPPGGSVRRADLGIDHGAEFSSS
jgi:hypothetical protein